MKCSICMSSTVKNGKTNYGKQRYKCKSCKTTFTYKAYEPNINHWIIRLIKEGTGIRSIARLLSISPTTVLKRILAIASKVQPPTIKKRQLMNWMKCVLEKKPKRYGLSML